MRTPAGASGAAARGDLRLTIVIPALNEADAIAVAVADARREADQVLVADGGSTDETVARARAAGARVVPAPRGRAVQMNAAAAAADGDVLLFLHADCRLPVGARAAVRRAVSEGGAWGRFDVALDSPRPLLRLVGSMMNLRSRLTGICTGDQAVFVTRAAWQACGGYPAIPLMEDIELSRLLRRIAPPACLHDRVRVSARRWERRGAWRTIVEMWAFRALHAIGVSPRWLHERYYGRSA